MYGSGHKVRNNTIKNPSLNGITLCFGLGEGKQASTLRIATTKCVILDNVIEDAGENGIFLGEGKGTDYSNHKNKETWNTGYIQNIPPSGNYITNNSIMNSKLEAIELYGTTNNRIEDNEYN